MIVNPSKHPICFFTPRRIQYYSGWHEHIPFAMLLVEILKPKVIVELGTQYGTSYCGFCQAVKELKLDTRCYAVDSWQGDAHTGEYGPEILKELANYHDNLYGNFSTLIQSTFDEAISRFEDGSIDLLHIDGYHVYTAVKHDFELWLPKMSPRGVILLHDISYRGRGFGVWKFWDELKSHYPNLEFSHSSGLGILAVGKDYPNKFKQLLTATPEEKQRFTDYFVALGQQISRQISPENKQGIILDLEIQLKPVPISTKVWFFNQYQIVVEKLMRQGTLRRRAYQLGLNGVQIILKEGWRSFGRKAKRRLKNRFSIENDYYQYWITKNEPKANILLTQVNDERSFKYRPQIGIFVFMDNPNLPRFKSAIESVIDQTYANWELILMDRGSTKPGIIQILREYTGQDSRIKVKEYKKKAGESGLSVEAIASSSAEFVTVLGQDDRLAPFALYETAVLMNEKPEVDFIYSDEDIISDEGVRQLPFFKPDWSPVLLDSCFYTGQLSLYRKGLAEKTGQFLSAYDLALRMSEKSRLICHIPQVFYHRRKIKGSATGGNQPLVQSSDITALQSAVERRKYQVEAKVTASPNGIRRVKFDLGSFPFISIIVPTDSKENILTCLKSLISNTGYDQFEVIVVTNSTLAQEIKNQFQNEKTLKTVEYNKKFNFSEKCNLGAETARGQYLVFLNDDMQVLTPDWLETMLESFARPEVGAVAPRLIFPDHTIQHAGLVSGLRAPVGTAFYGSQSDSKGDYGFSQSLREVSALSGAALMMPAQLFKQVGGYDQVNFPIAHSDIDLSFKIRQQGYFLLYTPFATLIHVGHVSLNKVKTTDKSDGSDVNLLKRWPQYIAYDPYYPPNMRDWFDQNADYGYELIVNKKEYLAKRNGNILLISHVSDLSGAPILLFNIATYLHNKGYFVTVISSQDGEMTQKYRNLGIPVIIEAFILDNPTPEITKLMANFDLVIANTILTWRSVHTCKSKNVPVLWMIHESEHGQDIANNNPDVGEALLLADSVVFSSKRVAELYREFQKNDNFNVIYYGIEVPKNARNYSVRSNSIQIITAGNIGPRKGQDVLLQSILNLDNAMFVKCEFTFIGRFVSQDHNQMFAEAIKNFNNIHTLDTVSYEKLFEFYNQADIYVCSSRDEVLPLTVLEAMSQGLAVIATEVGGIPEIIENGVNGVLVPKDNVMRLTEELTQLINNEELRMRLGKNAARKFEESFTLEKYGERLLPMIEKLIKSGKEK